MTASRVHGTRSRYSIGCRCTECRAASALYEKRRNVLGTNLVDATPAREHIAMLRASGLGRLTIAKRAGVAKTVINRLAGIDHSKPASRVRPDTLARILAVQPGRLAAGASVDPTGTRRRLQALVTTGHTITDLAHDMGWSLQNLSRFIHKGQGCNQRTADLVEQIYQRLHMTPGSSQRARNHAARHGWLPPLAWDDIDNPDEQPSSGVDRSISGESIVELRDNQQLTWEGICQRLGIHRDTAERAYHRHKKVTRQPGNTTTTQERRTA